MFCGCSTELGGEAEQPDLPDLPRPARRAAGGQRDRRGVRDPDRPRAELRDRRVVPLRPEELLLSGHAEELPDLPVRRADRLQRLPGRPAGGRRGLPRARSSAPTWRRTPASPRTWAARPAVSTAPRTRCWTTTGPASRSIEIVTKPIEGAGERAPEVAKAYVAELRELIRALGVSEARMEMGQMRCDVNLSLRPNGRGEVRHPQRDEERQLAAQRRARRTVRGPAARRGARRAAAPSCRRPGTSTRRTAPPPPAGSRRRRRTTATSPSPTWCPSRPRASGSRSCAASLPELPRVRRNRLREEWGISRARDAVGAQRGRRRA